MQRPGTIGPRILYALRASLPNPHAILDTVVVIGGGAALYSTAGERLAYAAAAVLVSWGWFFGISLAGRALGQLRHPAPTITWVNRVSASLMWIIAARYLLLLVQLLWTAQASSGTWDKNED